MTTAGSAQARRLGVSAVLPAYNEEALIGQTVRHLARVLRDLVDHFEIVVVNDGSRDRTGAIVAALQDDPTLHVRVVTHPTNRGYGAALASGFDAARHELILLLDADGQFEAAEVIHFLAALDEQTDLAIGWRWKRADPPLRLLNADHGRVRQPGPAVRARGARLGRRDLVTFDPTTGAAISTAQLEAVRVDRLTRLRRAPDGASLDLFATDWGIARIDLSSDPPRMVGHATLRSRAAAVAPSQDGSLLYASDGEVWSADLRSLVTWFPAAGSGIDLALDAATNHLYIITPGTDAGLPQHRAALLEIDAATYALVRAVPIDADVQQFRLAPDASAVYVGLASGVMRVDLSPAQLGATTVPSLLRPPESAVRDPSDGPPPAAPSGPQRTPTAPPATTVFRESFDGSPATPQPFDLPVWDVTVHTAEPSAWWLPQPFLPAYGPDCGPPPAQHTATTWAATVVRAADHLMTSLEASPSGDIVLTPNHLIDFSAGPAHLSFDLSTYGATPSNWIDVWLTPFDDVLQLPGNGSDRGGLNGLPPRAVHVSMGSVPVVGVGQVSHATTFIVEIFRPDQLGPQDYTTGASIESVVAPSAVQRDRFELDISRTHVAFGMPAYNLWWADTDVRDLGWSQAVVQLGHHSRATSRCDIVRRDPADCDKNTWHWDTIEVAPGRQVEVSTDDGASWQPALVKPGQLAGPGSFMS